MGHFHSPGRRRFLGTGAAAAAAAFAGSSPLALASEKGNKAKRDLALINGRIHTLDANDTVVDSLLIKDGRFAMVGGLRDAGDAQVINLKGRTVIPGIVDNHVHFIRIGNAVGHDERRLETALSVAEAQAVIRARAARVPEGEFITALAGIARRQFAEGRFPNIDELTDAAPKHPVVISELTVAQTNRLGRDILRAEPFNLTVSDAGVISNQNNVYSALAGSLTVEGRKRQLLETAKFALEVGLTTVMDQHGSTGGAGFIDRSTGHDFYLELVREGTLNVRTRVFFPEQTDVALLQGILDNRWREFGNDMHRTTGIGEWAPRGTNYQESLRRMAERGWIYHQHLISTGEIQTHLDQLAAFRAANPTLPSPGDLHWSIGHIDGITEAQVRQANDLGLGLAPHPWQYLTGNNPGPDFRTILDVATVPVGSGLDGARVAPLNPWNGIYFMTTGKNSGGVQRNMRPITRTEAIRMWAGPQQGWFSREQNRLGGIAPGRYADLVVLNGDVFNPAEVPDEKLRHTTSVLTVVDGRVVHDAGVLKA